MNAFWHNLAKETFVGRGQLACNAKKWDCRFWIAQLINGRIVVQVQGLNQSVFSDLFNYLDRITPCSIVGELEGGQPLEATNIDFNWNVGSHLEGFVLYPGFVEIKHVDYKEEFYPRIIYEVTNLSLGKQSNITATVENAKLKVCWLSKHNKILRYAQGLKSARVLSLIDVDFVQQSSQAEQQDLINGLCDLLTLAQRSYVSIVAEHWQAADGATKRSQYQEPVFDYPPAPRPLIPANALTNFIETTFSNYNKFWDSWNLPWIIDYYVQSISLQNDLAQSPGSFTALEALKAAFLKQKKISNTKLEHYVDIKRFQQEEIVEKIMHILSDSFEEFRGLVANDSSEGHEKKPERQALIRRIENLNERPRPRYRDALKAMFGDLKVFYDDDDLKHLVLFRDKIIHGSIPDYETDDAAHLTWRFSSLVEKTILAILKYQGERELYDQIGTSINQQN